MGRWSTLAVIVGVIYVTHVTDAFPKDKDARQDLTVRAKRAASCDDPYDQGKYYRCMIGENEATMKLPRCDPGTQTTCEKCADGMYKAAKGNFACLHCPDGYESTPGFKICKAASRNRREADDDDSEDMDSWFLAAGQTAVAGRKRRQIDATEYDFTDSDNQKEYYKEYTKGHAALKCGKGKTAKCEPCPAGTFKATGNPMQCINCPPGISSHAGARFCDANCPPGTWWSVGKKGTKAKCKNCKKRKYKDVSRPESCGKCPDNYVAVQPIDTEYGQIACECVAPEAPANGEVTADGVIATYTCNPKYSVSGSPTRQCQQDGSGWSGPEPTCGCVAPKAPANGEVTADGVIATYTCNPKYSVSGSPNRQCLQDGSGWSGPEPTCDPIDTCVQALEDLIYSSINSISGEIPSTSSLTDALCYSRITHWAGIFNLTEQCTATIIYNGNEFTTSQYTSNFVCGLSVLKPCAVGSYRWGGFDTFCTPCGPGRTTRGTGSTSYNDCIGDCGPGSYNDSVWCKPCPVGSYRENSFETSCTPCGPGMATMGTGSTSAADCIDGTCVQELEQLMYDALDSMAGVIGATMTDVLCNNGSTDWDRIKDLSGRCTATIIYNGIDFTTSRYTQAFVCGGSETCITCYDQWHYSGVKDALVKDGICSDAVGGVVDCIRRHNCSMEAAYVFDSLSTLSMHTADGHELFEKYMTEPGMYATLLAEDYKRLCYSGSLVCSEQVCGADNFQCHMWAGCLCEEGYYNWGPGCSPKECQECVNNLYEIQNWWGSVGLCSKFVKNNIDCLLNNGCPNDQINAVMYNLLPIDTMDTSQSIEAQIQQQWTDICGTGGCPDTNNCGMNASCQTEADSSYTCRCPDGTRSNFSCDANNRDYLMYCHNDTYCKTEYGSVYAVCAVGLCRCESGLLIYTYDIYGIYDICYPYIDKDWCAFADCGPDAVDCENIDHGYLCHCGDGSVNSVTCSHRTCSSCIDIHRQNSFTMELLTRGMCGSGMMMDIVYCLAEMSCTKEAAWMRGNLTYEYNINVHNSSGGQLFMIEYMDYIIYKDYHDYREIKDYRDYFYDMDYIDYSGVDHAARLKDEYEMLCSRKVCGNELCGASIDHCDIYSNCECPDGSFVQYGSADQECVTDGGACDQNPCGAGTCRVLDDPMMSYICHCDDGSVNRVSCGFDDGCMTCYDQWAYGDIKHTILQDGVCSEKLLALTSCLERYECNADADILAKEIQNFSIPGLLYSYHPLFDVRYYNSDGQFATDLAKQLNSVCDPNRTTCKHTVCTDELHSGCQDYFDGYDNQCVCEDGYSSAWINNAEVCVLSQCTKCRDNIRNIPSAWPRNKGICSKYIHEQMACMEQCPEFLVQFYQNEPWQVVGTTQQQIVTSWDVMNEYNNYCSSGDICSEVDCFGGTCIEGDGVFTCDCDDGSTSTSDCLIHGWRCETDRECETTFSTHNIICVSNLCQCVSGKHPDGQITQFGYQHGGYHWNTCGGRRRHFGMWAEDACHHDYCGPDGSCESRYNGNYLCHCPLDEVPINTFECGYIDCHTCLDMWYVGNVVNSVPVDGVCSSDMAKVVECFVEHNCTYAASLIAHQITMLTGNVDIWMPDGRKLFDRLWDIENGVNVERLINDHAMFCDL